MDLTTAFIPYITEFSPTELSSDVTTQPSITATFTLDMMIGTFGNDSETANAYLNEYVVLTDRAADSTYSVELVAYDAKKRTLTFRPTEQLDPGATYTVSVLAGFQAATGRGMVEDETWKFTVAATSVDRVALVTPVTSTMLTESPTLSWSPVTTPGATYHLQISTDPAFRSISQDIPELTLTSAGPFTLDMDVTYYWRVRAEVGITVGPWSGTSQFIIKSQTAVEIAPGSIFDTFNVLSIYPKPGTACNLVAWPTIVMKFNRQLSDAPGVFVIARHADTGATADPAPEYTVTVSGSEIRITFQSDIQENTYYEVDIPSATSIDGLQLSEPISINFTGPYTPFYTTPSVLRGRYGRFLRRFTEADIAYHIHRASLKCNRLVMDAGSSPVSSLLIAQTVTFDMEAYVEAYTAYCLIQAYQYEVLEQAGRRHQLDTITADVEARLISDIDDILKSLALEVKRLEISLKGAPSPVSGVRSGEWSPSQMYEDQSVSGLVRAKF